MYRKLQFVCWICWNCWIRALLTFVTPRTTACQPWKWHHWMVVLLGFTMGNRSPRNFGLLFVTKTGRKYQKCQTSRKPTRDLKTEEGRPRHNAKTLFSIRSVHSHIPRSPVWTEFLHVWVKIAQGLADTDWRKFLFAQARMFDSCTCRHTAYNRSPPVYQ